MKLLADLPPVDVDGPAPLPLVGGTPNVLSFFRDPIGRLSALHAAHGDVVALNRHDATWIAVRGPERLRQVLAHPGAFHNLADSPVPVPAGSAPAVLLGEALTALNGEAHRRARRVLQPLFSRGAVAGYHAEMAATVDRVVGGWSAGEQDVAALTLDLALQVAMASLFGVEPGADAAAIARLSQRFLDGVLSMGVMLFPYALPGTPYTRWMRDCEEYAGILRRLVADRRAAPSDRRDVLSTLIAARDEDGSTMGESELVAHGAVLLTASHETTANTLAWTLLLLAAHPRIQADLLDELSPLGGAAPTVAQLGKLPLLDRVVKESQRLLPASCILFFREAAEPFELGGHALPAGTRLLTSPYLAHRDPAVYADPQRFLPARWESIDPSPYSYLPFGAGPRLCVGATFASQAVRVALAGILQRFRFELATPTHVDRHVRGITLGSKSGVRLRMSTGSLGTQPGTLRGDLHTMIDGLPGA